MARRPVGLNIINNVAQTNQPKATQNTTNTLETIPQSKNAKGSDETATSKKESESEYVTDSDLEPATEDEIEMTILDSDFEQSKISKEKPSSLMEKVKEILSFAKFVLFMIDFDQTILQIDVVFNTFLNF